MEQLVNNQKIVLRYGGNTSKITVTRTGLTHDIASPMHDFGCGDTYDAIHTFAEAAFGYPSQNKTAKDVAMSKTDDYAAISRWFWAVVKRLGEKYGVNNVHVSIDEKAEVDLKPLMCEKTLLVKPKKEYTAVKDVSKISVVREANGAPLFIALPATHKIPMKTWVQREGSTTLATNTGEPLTGDAANVTYLAEGAGLYSSTGSSATVKAFRLIRKAKYVPARAQAWK